MARKTERWTLSSSFIDKTHGGEPKPMTERVVDLQKDSKTGKWVVHEVECHQLMPEEERKAVVDAIMRNASEQMSEYISTHDSAIAPGTYKIVDLLRGGSE